MDNWVCEWVKYAHLTWHWPPGGWLFEVPVFRQH